MSADRLEKSESESDSEESQKTAPAPAELTPDGISRRLEEQRREHDRQSFVREWDRGKDGVARKSGQPCRFAFAEYWFDILSVYRPCVGVSVKYVSSTAIDLFKFLSNWHN